MDIKITTQQHKSVNLRTLVMSMLNGVPVSNVHHHEVFDLGDEPDFDSVVVDDFSDRLETMELHRQMFDDINNKINDYQQEKSKNPKPSDKTNTPPSSSEDKPQSAENNQNLSS